MTSSFFLIIRQHGLMLIMRHLGHYSVIEGFWTKTFATPSSLESWIKDEFHQNRLGQASCPGPTHSSKSVKTPSGWAAKSNQQWKKAHEVANSIYLNIQFCFDWRWFPHVSWHPLIENSALDLFQAENTRASNVVFKWARSIRPEFWHPIQGSNLAFIAEVFKPSEFSILALRWIAGHQMRWLYVMDASVSSEL